MADLLWGSSCVGCDRPGRALCVGCEGGWWRELRAGAVRAERDVAGVRCVSIGPYVAGLRRMVLAHKEEGVRALGVHLADVLAALVLDVLPAGTATGGVLLVPVPSRPSVVRARGDDPWRRVVRGAAARVRRAGIDAACRPLLATGRSVKDQAGLDRTERALNLEGGIRMRRAPSWCAPGATSTVVLCDDVVTSGATLRACLGALEGAGHPAALAVTLAAVELRAAFVRGRDASAAVADPTQEIATNWPGRVTRQPPGG